MTRIWRNGRRARFAGLLLAATVIVGLTGAQSNARTLPPRDECGADQSFRTFRARLLDAVERKDSRYLLSITSPTIRVHLGPAGEGRAAFAKEWKLDQPAVSLIWDELKAVLELGCAQDGETMTSPHLFSRIPSDLDALNAVVAITSGAVLRILPERNAPIVTRLQPWEILNLSRWGEPEGWLIVQTSGGRIGYVEMSAIRSPIDYRASFERQDGNWMLTHFLAGD